MAILVKTICSKYDHHLKNGLISQGNKDLQTVSLALLQMHFAWLRLAMHTATTTDTILFMVISHLLPWQTSQGTVATASPF